MTDRELIEQLEQELKKVKYKLRLANNRIGYLHYLCGYTKQPMIDCRIGDGKKWPIEKK